MMRFSSTDISRNSRRASGTWTTPCPITLSGESSSRRTPSNSMDPFRGLRRPEIVLSVVDFPAPLAPTRTRISLSRTSNETSQRTWRSP